MAKLTVLSWNIEALGASKLKTKPGGAELLNLIAKVITNSKCQIAAICELTSQLGNYVGKELVKRLGSTWQFQETDAKLKLANDEQYLFLWQTPKVTKFAGPGSAFQLDFLDPATRKTIGFPRQKKLDRPPFLGRFEFNDPPNPPQKVLVALMHSPGPGAQNHVARAAQALAMVEEFRTEGDRCLIVGDFNVKFSSRTVPVPNAQPPRGPKAFGALVTHKTIANPPRGAPANNAFVQLFDNDILTSLTTVGQAFTKMTLHNCKSEPYDQIFLRTLPPGLTFSPPLPRGYDYFYEDLIEDQLPPRPRLAKELLALRHKQTGLTQLRKYPDVATAFIDFRRLVSDHLPVVADIWL